MEALEGKGDAMEALDSGGDAMEALEAVMPVLADEFEQEAEREVENAKGLDGKVEEGKMKLVHQVRHQVSTSQSPFRSPFAHTDADLTADLSRSRCPQTTRTPRSLNTFGTIPQRGRTKARPFPARRDELYRA